ncbi:hypothetical protein ACFQJD_07830 [Haloplanus sp. GCM10025708]|uniref:hypothetical protein n=1 Tax=Haloplanus sp. GCM10025708 TaxID=3252679 RepID=UPI003606928D
MRVLRSNRPVADGDLLAVAFGCTVHRGPIEICEVLEQTTFIDHLAVVDDLFLEPALIVLEPADEGETIIDVFDLLQPLVIRLDRFLSVVEDRWFFIGSPYGLIIGNIFEDDRLVSSCQFLAAVNQDGLAIGSSPVEGLVDETIVPKMEVTDLREEWVCLAVEDGPFLLELVRSSFSIDEIALHACCIVEEIRWGVLDKSRALCRLFLCPGLRGPGFPTFGGVFSIGAVSGTARQTGGSCCA